MNIAYFLTRNIYPYLLPSIMSLLDHNPRVRKIYVFCEDDVFPYQLPDCCQVINVTDQQWIRHTAPNWGGQFTWMGLVKMCTPKLMPKVQKVITLDVDTIVNDSLDPIWALNLRDNYIAMADEKIGHWRITGHPKYYNFGVAVWNLKQIREDKVDDQLIETMNTRWLQYIGQDAWNILYYDKIVELDTRFNETQFTGRTDHPAIVHYAGTGQWWLPHLDRHEYYDEYRHYERY